MSSRVDQAAVVEALRQCLTPPEHVRDLAFRAGLSLGRTKDAVQALRYQGKIKFETLALSASMGSPQSNTLRGAPMLAVEEGAASGGLDAVTPVGPGVESAPLPANGSEGRAPHKVVLCGDPSEPRVAAGAGEQPVPATPSEQARGHSETAARLPAAGVDSPPGPGGSLSTTAAAAFLAEIDVYLARTRFGATEFGALALGHPGFVGLLTKRLSARSLTVERVRAFMARFPEGATRTQVLNWRAEEAARIAAEVGDRSLAKAPGRPIPAAEPVPLPAPTPLQREIAAEAAARGVSRAAARVLSATRKGGTSPLIEAIQTGLLEEPEDLFAFLRRRWPELLQRVIAAARAAGKSPARMMADVIALGLLAVAEGQLEEAA